MKLLGSYSTELGNWVMMPYCSFKMLLLYYVTTQCYVPENCNFKWQWFHQSYDIMFKYV